MEEFFSQSGERVETATKAVTFKLLPLTKTKQERLLALAKNFKEIYNYAAIMMPSLQTVKQSQARSVLNQWRKDLKNKTMIHSKIAEEAIEYARANYQAILAQGESRIPELNEPIIRIHNQAWVFEKHNGTIYVVIPSERESRHYVPMWLPVKSSEYYKEIINNTQKWGVGQINLKDLTFTTSVTTKREIVDYTPETFIGIDLGLNNLATLAILDKNKKIVQTKFWNGKEIRHIRKRFHKYRGGVSKIGRIDLVIKTKGHESNWMKNVNHNISRNIVEMARQYPNPILVMENLRRFTNLRWNFYQLRQMILYKADLNNIKTKLIEPKNTSITCYKCGYISEDNRNCLDFKCIRCGYNIHSDLNAAINIAIVGAKL